LVKHTLKLEELEVDFVRFGRHIFAEALCLFIKNGLDLKLANFDFFVQKTLRSVQLASRIKLLLQLSELLAQPRFFNSFAQSLNTSVVRFGLENLRQNVLALIALLFSLPLFNSLVFALFFLFNFLSFLKVLWYVFQHANALLNRFCILLNFVQLEKLLGSNFFKFMLQGIQVLN